MDSINIERINTAAPYQVVLIEDASSNIFYFSTEFGVEYEIIIKSNNLFVPSGAYVLDIINVWHKTSPGDAKFKQTLLSIVEEFFRCHNDVLLYVTETKDSKQAFRNRLFVRWFNTYEMRSLYFIQTAEGKMDGQDNFMAIISRRDNPNLLRAIKEFENTISFLFD